jgi:hypothetical protein
MSKTLSYRGQLPIGVEERIRLRTIKGKIGYRIKQFQIISSTPGAVVSELVGKITKVKDPNIGPAIDFSNSDLMAVSYTQETTSSSGGSNQIIIFDNEVTNQNIFVSISDAGSGTTPANYYIELETMSLDDTETTMLTLKNLKAIASQ